MDYAYLADAMAAWRKRNEWAAGLRFESLPVSDQGRSAGDLRHLRGRMAASTILPMRLLTLAAVLLLAHIAGAADYPLVAKIKSVTTESSQGHGRVGGETVHVASVSHYTAVQIEGRVYTSTQVCPLVLAGEEYPARIDTKKGNRFAAATSAWLGAGVNASARIEIHLRVAGKDCRLIVTGSEEGR